MSQILICCKCKNKIRNLVCSFSRLRCYARNLQLVHSSPTGVLWIFFLNHITLKLQFSATWGKVLTFSTAASSHISYAFHFDWSVLELWTTFLSTCTSFKKFKILIEIKCSYLCYSNNGIFVHIGLQKILQDRTKLIETIWPIYIFFQNK